jgi:hypothetical protein
VVISGTSHERIGFGTDIKVPINAPFGPDLLYLARFTATGNLIDGRALGSSTPMESVGIGLDGKLGSVLVGSFQQPIDSENGLTYSAGGWDVLVSHTN